jgi:glutamyl-tRNA synthetase
MNINAHYLRHMPMAELLPFIKARLAKTDLWKPAFETEQRSWFVSTMELIRGRFNTLNDFETYGRAYINDDFIMDETAVRKNLKEAAAGQWLPELAKRLSELKDFESGTIEAELRLFLKDKDIKPGKLMNAVRTAITGQGVGPDFMKVLTVLGRQRVVNRLISAAGISV